MPSLKLSDPKLIQRLEATEAAGGLACVEADRMRDPDSKAESMPVAGGYAVYVAPDSPLNHTLGMGVQGTVGQQQLDQMEEFYKRLGSPSLIDLCPYCDRTLVEELSKRGYRILEFNNVMLRSISEGDTESASEDLVLRIVQARDSERAEWAGLMCQGFQLPAEFRGIGETLFFDRDARCYFVEIEGQPVATAALAVREGVAAFLADSTLAEARGMGAHTRLIQHRLREAAQAGCELAMVGVLPGSASHRNYERAGFEVAYTRANLIREW